MSIVLDLCYLAATVVLSPWLVYKAATAGKYRRGMWRKLTGRAVTRDSDARCAWFHGVSVGEIHLLGPVVQAFREEHPDWDCVVSTTTDTGYQEACKRFADLPVFYWPLDFSWSVGRAIRAVNPSLVVLSESELWPNFLSAARRRGARVALINARISPRSCRTYQRFGRLANRLFEAIDLIAAQNQEYAAFFAKLGVPAERIVITGSVKFDGANVGRVNPKTYELAELLAIRSEVPVWIAGSTQAPEEEIALAVFQKLRARHPTLRLMIVPRQRERFEEVRALLDHSGVSYVRRSDLREPVSDTPPVILLDTIGELGALWPLATVGFVGGSLDGKRGGQNMIEPAAAGVPTAFGPHVWNFQETATQLVASGGAVQIADARGLEAVMDGWLSDPEERTRRGDAARSFVETQRGACRRTIQALDRLIASGTLDRQAA